MLTRCPLALIEDRTTRSDGREVRPSPLANHEAKHLVRALVEVRDAGVRSEEEFEAKRVEVTAKEKAPLSDGWRRMRRED